MQKRNDTNTRAGVTSAREKAQGGGVARRRVNEERFGEHT